MPVRTPEKPNTSNMPAAPTDWRSIQGRLTRHLTEYTYITGYRQTTPDMWYQPRPSRDSYDRERAIDELIHQARQDAANLAQALADALRNEA